MTSYKDPQVRRKLIMDHYQNPRFKVAKLEHQSCELFSQFCVDELHLELNWKKDILKNAHFSGKGCAVFLASVDLMLELIIGKSKKEIKEIVSEYQKMLLQKETYDLLLLEKLAIFENVARHLNRLHCAQMIALVLEKELYA